MSDLITEPLALVKCDAMSDWYTIERAHHDGREWWEPTKYGQKFMCSARISDACVEGPAFEMLALADAIDAHGEEHFKRCAVEWVGDCVRMWSPRNSERHALVAHDVALALAAEIRRVLP